jgi:hypothetical protein
MFWKPNETIGNCCFAQQEIMIRKLLKPKLNDNTFFISFSFLMTTPLLFPFRGDLFFSYIPYLRK